MLRPHLEPTDIISILVVEPSDNSISAWLLIIQSLSLLHFGVQGSKDFPAIHPIPHVCHHTPNLFR